MNAKFIVLLVMTLALASFASAQNLDIEYVKINGDEMDTAVIGDHLDNLRVERGEDLELRVRVKATADVEDIQVEADIYGYEYSDREHDLVSDTSDVFDLDAGDVDTINLDLQVPTKMDKDYVLLRIRVADRDGPSYETVYQLRVSGIDDSEAVRIKDFSLDPSSVVNAGRAFTGQVRVENIGDDDLDDIKVTIAVPELNIKDTEYLDELEEDEKETLEEFLLRVPDCATAGVYDVDITVEFDEYETATEHTTLTVIPGDTCVAQRTTEERPLITVPESVEVDAGNEAAFPMFITNRGTTDKRFTVTLQGVESWGSSRISPSSVLVVEAGRTQTVYLYVTPDMETAGEQLFLATVSTDDGEQSVTLKANVEEAAEESSSVDVRRGLEIALVVLVVILIIVGLIIGFNKLRGQEDDSTQTYY